MFINVLVIGEKILVHIWSLIIEISWIFLWF